MFLLLLDSLVISYPQNNLSLFMILYFGLIQMLAITQTFPDFSCVFFFFFTCVVPGNPYYDSLGSLGVGTLLGAVSAFLIYTNTEALLGRSIQAERVQKLTEFLENDPAVRSASVQTRSGVYTHTHLQRL